MTIMTLKIELPEFDKFYELSENIKKKSLELSLVDLDISKQQAEIAKRAMVDTSLYVKGKPPSMEYLKNTLFVTGIDDELLSLLGKKETLEAELDYLKRQYEILKIITEIWRTQSANERSALI